MEQFKKVTVEDRDILAKYLNLNQHRACDYSVANIVLWSDVYDTQYTIAQDTLFIKFMRGKDTYFSYPMADFQNGGDLKLAFAWLQSYCEERNLELKINIIEPAMFEEIEKVFPNEYEIAYQRDNADYVYLVEDLKNLSGKKYHGKKNHINKFLKTNEDWTYERISDENTDECIKMVEEWCVENRCCEDKSKADEICVLINGLRYREKLDLIGGIIKTSGRIIALTMGEKSGDDMFIIHFEKAFAGVDGAYPMINQQFIIHELLDYKYVNREEDMGVEGLRKAKESYKPVFMAEKGILIKK